MSLVSTRRQWLTATMGGASITALVGCSGGSDGPLVDGEAHSREHWRVDLDADETIAITVTIVERGDVYDKARIVVETVADGEVAKWKMPKSDVEDTFRYTAARSAEHTLKVYGVGIAEVTVEEVDDA